MIAVTADFTVDQKNAETAEAILTKLAEAVESEAGNLCYDILRPCQSEPVFRVYEVYESEEAFEAHKTSDHFQAIFPDFRKLLTASPVVTYHDLIARARR